MDDMRFYVLFNSISVISGRWEVDNERLCAMELETSTKAKLHNYDMKVYLFALSNIFDTLTVALQMH